MIDEEKEEPEVVIKQYCVVPLDNLEMLVKYFGQYVVDDELLRTDFKEFCDDAKKGVYAFYFRAERAKMAAADLLRELKVPP